MSSDCRTLVTGGTDSCDETTSGVRDVDFDLDEGHVSISPMSNIDDYYVENDWLNDTLIISTSGSATFSVSIVAEMYIIDDPSAYTLDFEYTITVYNSSYDEFESDSGSDSMTVDGAFLDVSASFSSTGGSESDEAEVDDTAVVQSFTIELDGDSTEDATNISVCDFLVLLNFDKTF